MPARPCERDITRDWTRQLATAANALAEAAEAADDPGAPIAAMIQAAAVSAHDTADLAFAVFERCSLAGKFNADAKGLGRGQAAGAHTRPLFSAT
jgi:hypothetical protein